jgi:pilus assembly protein Flp/PilA
MALLQGSRLGEPFLLSENIARKEGAKMLDRFYSWLIHEEEGATAVEYGVMVALIAVVIIAAVTLLGQNLVAMFTRVVNAIQ